MHLLSIILALLLAPDPARPATPCGPADSAPCCRIRVSSAATATMTSPESTAWSPNGWTAKVLAGDPTI